MDITPDILKKHIKNDEYLVFNNSLISQYDTTKLRIKDSRENLKLLLLFSNEKLKEIEFKNCKFKEIWINDSNIKDLKLTKCEVGDKSSGLYIKPYRFFIHNSTIEHITMFFPVLWSGLIIRNSSSIKRIHIINGEIDNDIVIVGSSISDTIELEKCKFPKLEIREKAAVHKVNIFRCTIYQGINLYDSEVSYVHLHKNDILADKSKYELSKGFSIINVRNLEEVKLTENSIDSYTRLSLDKCPKLFISSCNFGDFGISHWNCDININNSNFHDNAFFGASNRGKSVDKLEIDSTIFEKNISLRNYRIKKSFRLSGNLFQGNITVFEKLVFEKGCETNFEYSNFANCIFTRIDFSQISLEDFDLLNPEFEQCIWSTSIVYLLKKRLPIGYKYSFIDEDKPIRNKSSLERIKFSYFKLKQNFYNKENYYDGGRFYIAQQDINLRILKSNNEIVKFLVLKSHRTLSLYGENIWLPLLWFILFTLVFAVIFLFSGFSVNDRDVQYIFEFSKDNFSKTLLNFLHSFVLSLKNVIPVDLDSDFFIHTSKKFNISQFFSLLHKIINIVILGSIINSISKFVKK